MGCSSSKDGTPRGALGAVTAVGAMGAEFTTAILGSAIKQMERQVQLAVGPDEEYIAALQKYAFISAKHHHVLAPKKIVPAPKPPPLPPSVIESWSCDQLCDFVHNCCAVAYGDSFPALQEVLANFRHHFIDGGRIKHLDDDDWQVLCPYSGPRTLIMEQVKAANPGAAPPKPICLKRSASPASSSPLAASQSPTQEGGCLQAMPSPDAPLNDLQRILATLPTINPESQPVGAEPHKAHAKGKPKALGEGHSLLYEDMSDNENDSPSVASPTSIFSDAPGFANNSTPVPNPLTVQIDMNSTAIPSSPQVPPQSDAMKYQLPGRYSMSCKMLLERSKFSNHRLIDTQWQPDASRNWFIRIWQIFFYEVLRVLFVMYIFRKFALRMRQIPYFIVPLISVYVCLRYGWFVDFSPTLFTNIVVFPLSFALNAAYQRREQALQTLASIKSSALSIHLFAESWVGTQLELPETYVLDTTRIIKAVFRTMGHYLTAINEEDKELLLHNIFLQFFDLFYHVDLIRLSGLPPPLITVPFNNVINMMTGFERLRNFSDYRTPCTIRSYCKACMAVLSFALAPFFANVSDRWGVPYGFLLCMIFFWLLVCMDNIQAMLENPFITFGRMNAEDDINLSSLKGMAMSKKAKRRLRKQLAAALAAQQLQRQLEQQQQPQ